MSGSNVALGKHAEGSTSAIIMGVHARGWASSVAFPSVIRHNDDMGRLAIHTIGAFGMGADGLPEPIGFKFKFEGEGEINLAPVGRTIAGWPFDELHSVAHGDPCIEGNRCPYRWKPAD